jgi:hypothetical protein
MVNSEWWMEVDSSPAFLCNVVEDIGGWGAWQLENVLEVSCWL